MRTRNKNTLLSKNDVIYYDHNYKDGTTNPSPYGTIKYGNGEISQMKDFVTPGFRKIQRQGNIVNNDMSSWRCVLSYPEAHYSARVTIWDAADNLVEDYGATCSQGITADGHVGTRFFSNLSEADRGSLLASLPGVPDMPTAEQVLVRAIANASNTDALALVTLAEGKKTMASIQQASNALHRIWGYMSRLRPRDFTPTGALRHVGTGLAVWLEVRYGLLPTYYDILGYANIAKSLGKKSRVRFTSVAEGHSNLGTDVASFNNSFYYETKLTTKSRHQKIRAGILVEPVAENVEAITSLGIDRLASTAWELVPFSFIVDWFLNTAQVIAAHEGRFSQRDLATWVTIRDHVRTEFRMRTLGRDYRDLSGSNWRYRGMYSRDFDASEDYIVTVRKANPKKPLLPSFQIRLDWKKCTDLAAISSKVLSGLRR